MTVPSAEHCDLPPPELLSYFQSLGDNCEFGLVQRSCGIEPLGLFRFNWTMMRPLLEVLGNGFAQVGQPDLIEIYQEASTLYMVRHHPYQFQYHTFLSPTEITREKLFDLEVKRLAFLKRAFIEDLEEGKKIFVRKGNTDTEGQVAGLLRALRKYGKATLLWVTLEDAGHPAGTVERVEDGLLRGYIDRFAPYDDAQNFSAVCWLQLCSNAWTLTHGGSTLHRIGPRPLAPGKNLAPADDMLGGGGWLRLPASPTGLVPRAPEAGVDVLCHWLAPDTAAYAGEVGCGPALADPMVGASYVASALVWIPSSFQGDIVGATLRGLSSTGLGNADTSKRDVWQPIWVAAQADQRATPLHFSLYLKGIGGDHVFSTGWKVRGARPTAASDQASLASPFGAAWSSPSGGQNTIPAMPPPQIEARSSEPWFRTDYGCLQRAPQPFQEECPVLAHASLQDVGTARFACMVSVPATNLSLHVVSAWIWIPAGFGGDAVGMFIDGIRSVHIDGARLSVRDQWQRVWTSVKIPQGRTSIMPALYVSAPAGDILFSTCWKVEEGVVPTEYTAPVDPRTPS